MKPQPENTASPVSSTPINGEAVDRKAGGTPRDLYSSTADGVAFGLMVGLGETYFPAFALAIGLGEIFAGLIASVPMIAGGLMQLISPIAIQRLGSNRRWVVACAAVQTLSFLPLAIAALVGHLPGWFALVIVSGYWASGLASGPAWNTWIETLVPQAGRAQFFARRTRLSHAAVLCGFLIGGSCLQMATDTEWLLPTFAGTFFAASIFRLISTWFLSRQSEPVPVVAAAIASPLATWKSLKGKPASRLLTYLIAVQASVQLSGPFFAPYMLEQIKLSYAEFVTLIAMSFIGKIVALPVAGKLGGRYGAYLLLWIGGLGIIPLPALWIFSQSMAWLSFVQIVCGMAWASYELGFFLLFFESIPSKERTATLTLYNFVNSLALVGGALVGASLLGALGTSTSSYLTLFGLSSVVRVTTLILLWRVAAIPSNAFSIAFRALSLRPNTASVDAPIVASLSDKPKIEPQVDAA